MLIANPIYDVVFKYLMKDEKVAKLLLSAILGKEVTELEFRPTEQAISLGHALTVMRMDFSARIEDANGHQELVILELQKAKLATDIMRFRRYLGKQYSNANNVVREPGEKIAYGKALPIISIYFLGHGLQHTKAPVVRVNRHYIDAATGKKITEKEDFIESLTHDSVIIQIPYLKGKRRNELEKLLAIFDQASVSYDPHFLNISEEELPERYRPLLRRLQKAMADEELINYMEAEDDVVEEYRSMQRQLNIKEELLSAKDKAISQKEEVISQKEEVISQKEEVISQKDKVISEKEQAIKESKEKLAKAIIQLYRSGTSEAQLAEIFRLPTKEIKKILNAE